MSRIVDRGAVTGGWVGFGMALVIGVSFLLVIPIEPIDWILAPFSGLLIGYYANVRAGRGRGAWPRIVTNALYAGAVTGLTAALLLLGVKALFFAADDGYRDGSLGKPLVCRTGADCVYQRYLDAGRGPDLVANGVADVDAFSRFYWSSQLQTAGTLLALTLGGALVGGIVYGATRPRPGQATRNGPEAKPTAG